MSESKSGGKTVGGSEKFGTIAKISLCSENLHIAKISLCLRKFRYTNRENFFLINKIK